MNEDAVINGCSKELSSNSSVMITEQERELATSALNEFKKRNYVNCLTFLNKLESLRPKDLKVMHNKIIVEYYKSDLMKTELARKSLNAIGGSPVSEDSAGDGANDGTDDAEKCVMRYNQAVVLFHSRQYELALQILEKLFSFVEPMEENLAWKVCLFLIELYIQTNRLALALALVNYVENQFICSNVTDSKMNPGSTSAINLEKPDAKITVKDNGKKNDGWMGNNTDSNNEICRIKLLKYKVRLLLLLQHPKLCKKEWKLLMSLTGSPGAEAAGSNISTVFLKAHLEYVRGNYSKSMSLLNSCTGNSADNLEYKVHGESAAVIYYNNIACVHFARGKPNLAAFYLKRALVENKKAVDAARVKDNNAGNSAGQDNCSSQFLYTLGGGDKHHELMFNLGVALLGANQATKAFDCFTEAARGCTRLHNSPELWLRMAECCIHCYKPSNKIDFDMTTRRQRPMTRGQRGRCQDLVQKVIGGVGQHRKIILASALNKDSRYHTQSLAYAMPQPTLEFAMLCLKNALLTLSRSPYEEATDKSAKSMLITTPPGSSFLSDGNATGLLSSGSTSLATGIAEETGTIINAGTTIQILQAKWMSEAINLKIAILTASAYVSLCLGDYVLALEHARTLLKIESLPGAYKMLGNLYAAESLILMDKINEAIAHLRLQNLEDISTAMPTVVIPADQDDDDSDKKNEVKRESSLSASWFPKSLNTAKGILRYNLAVSYAIRGELDKSGETLKQVWLSKGPDCDVPIHVIMLALYIELKLGHDEVARSIVKQHCPQYWV
ncbi:CCR4-NOT transcription complex subunit 10 [Microplitis demolitor]|uniref:CCR4-NOT transcription complex subunit 10 n=1 Tax=Microplitis demolitor TaxID=69319 RepID=UPI0004CD7FD3|nr:CCR4-NOT transcription complex subunit 10 [Microplitis demolitor]